MALRQLFEIPLQPVAGSRFQPTGFPNLGAATFERPTADGGWQTALLVESTQSMANHLERTLWPAGASEPDDVIRDLPYVVVCENDGTFVTSSRVEPHRLASVYIRKAKLDGDDFQEILSDRLGLDSDRQRAPRELAHALFALDPLCLLHGLFLSDKGFKGQPKVPRAITAFVEAHDVREAHSGGVKKDPVSSSLENPGGTTEGYGMVPYDRTDWVARDIIAYAVIDLDQLESYGLGDSATELLANIARLELRRLLDGSLRLRTACDLETVNGIADTNGEPLPTAEDLEKRVRTGIDEVADLIDSGGPITVIREAS